MGLLSRERGRGGACSKALRPGAHGAWRGHDLRMPPPCRLPLSCAWRLRGHRGPLCHRQERCPRTPVREARWRSKEKRIWVASLRMRYWLLPPPCGRGRGPGASLASGQVVLTQETAFRVLPKERPGEETRGRGMYWCGSHCLKEEQRWRPLLLHLTFSRGPYGPPPCTCSARAPCSPTGFLGTDSSYQTCLV